MNFLNFALIFEVTKRNENLNILMGSILMGAFFAFLIFGIFQLCFKILHIPRKHRFKALLVGTNMAIVVLFYRWLTSACMGWNDYVMISSALVALNTLIFIFKFKYLDK